MILLLDNYDSFTYNLRQYLDELTGGAVCVCRNDEISIEQAERFDSIVFSPGPGLPGEAGVMMSMIREFAGRKPLLGICLGHQAIVEAFGGRLKNLRQVLHGVVRPVYFNDSPHPLFKGLQSPMITGRYHSWVPDDIGFPDELEVLARDGDGEIMVLAHRRHHIHGLQFHPESVMTPSGMVLLSNWLAITGQKQVSL